MSKKSITKNYFYNMAYQILILILPIVTTPYLSRVLGAEGIGIYSYTFSIVTYFIIFGSLGISLYGQREIAYVQDKPKERKKIFLELICIRFVTIFISLIVFYFIFVRNGMYKQYYMILMLEIIAAGFDISWFFQGLEEFKKTVLRNILVRTISVALVFILVKTEKDLITYMIIYSVADLVGNMSLWLYLPKYFNGIKINNVNLYRHFIPILALFVPQISNQIYKILDTTMLGKIITDKTETGYYDQAQKVIRLLLTIVTSLGVIMIPRMSNTYANGNKEEINKYMRLSFKFMFFLAFPITLGIVAVASNFVPIFFGEGYDKVVILIIVISPIILLMGIANVFGTQYLLPVKKQKEYANAIMVGVVVNFILNFILINKYAALGASIATVLSQVVVDVIQIKHVRKDIEIKPLFALAKNYILASFIMFIICVVVKSVLNHFIVCENMNLKNIILLISQVVIGVLVYIGTLVKMKDEYLFDFNRMVMNKIKVKS